MTRKFAMFSVATIALLFNRKSLSQQKNRDITFGFPESDINLKKKIKLPFDYYFIGEILEEVAKQSGVSVRCDNRDGSSNQEIVASFKEITLEEVMQSIWSLMSNRDASWRWTQERTNKGEYLYTLLQPRIAQEYPQRCIEAIDADFIGYVTALIESGDVKNTNILPSSKFIDRTALIIKETLSNEEINQAIRNKNLFIFPISKNKNANLMIQEYQAQSALLNPNSIRKEYTHFFLQKSIENYMVVPSMDFYIGKHTESKGDIIGGSSMESCGVVGNIDFEYKWIDRLRNLWMCDGDKSNLPEQETQRINDKKSNYIAKTKDEYSKWKPESVLHKLNQVSQETNILALLVKRQDISEEGKNIKDFLNNNKLSISHKWCGNTLLLRHNVWFRNYESHSFPDAPWYIYKKIEKEIQERLTKNPNRLITLDDCLFVAKNLSTMQIKHLSNLRPRLGILSHIADMHDIFAVFAENTPLLAEAQSPVGVRIDKRIYTALEQSKEPSVMQALEDESKRPGRLHLKVETKKGETVETTERYIILDIMDYRGQILMSGSVIDSLSRYGERPRKR
jgi:hypothetical protein